MPRTLQINLFEAPLDARRGRGGRRGFVRPGDPGENVVLAPPEDPGENVVLAPPESENASAGVFGLSGLPDDPGENVVLAPPENSSVGFGGLAGGESEPAAFGPTVTARYLPAWPGAIPLGGCGCSSKGASCHCDDKPVERPCISPGDHSGFLIVRLARGVGPLDVDSLWEMAEASGLEGLRAVLARPLGDEEIDGDDDEDDIDPDDPDDDAVSEESAPLLAGASGNTVGRRLRRRRLRRRQRQQQGYRGGKHAPSEEPGPAPAPEPWEPEPFGTLVSRPLIQIRDFDRETVVDCLRALAAQAARTAFPPRCGLERYWRVDLRDHPDLVAEVFDAFDALAEVDLVYRELTARDTANGQDAATNRGDDSLEGDQGYFESAPVGIGVRQVRKLLEGKSGSSIQIVDLEQGWLEQHQEIEMLGLSPVHGDNRRDDEDGAGHHGTAVLGQLAAKGVGSLGVVGSVHGLAQFHLASHYRTDREPASPNNPFPGTNGHVASAIVTCLIGGQNALLTQGDVLLLEIQRGRLPTEIDAADFDAIRLAVALGVTVIEAAGNGGFDLDRCDDPRTGQTLRRGAAGFVDSGAVMVGAAWSELPHDRAPFSNYGSRIDCYAWGEGVTTCGYGDLDGDTPLKYYTNTFDGTSSAAPIIAGAAGLLQVLHEETTDSTLSPLALRALLANRATGTPQGPNVGGHIGVMPDLERILRDVLGLVPAIYLRRDPCDDGTPPGRDETISSSPDLVLVDASMTPDLGEGSPSAHHPAPGRGSDGSASLHLHVRARNRGLAAGTAEVRLFSSPAATLITPDDWQPTGSATLADVPPGDILHPAGSSVAWVPDSGFPGFHAFLAVLFPGDCAPPPEASICALPPRMPYFDWRRYLEFLRGPNVAFRNVHPVSAGARLDLGFLLTGTPDRGRRFDLEILQRLPEGAGMQLRLSEALAASLGQRQPSIERDPADKGLLTLPRRRTVRFSHLRLPAGLRAPATFSVTTDDNNPLAPGHSLAIRQLWQGVEVGRVTWVVT